MYSLCDGRKGELLTRRYRLFRSRSTETECSAEFGLAGDFTDILNVQKRL